MLVNLINPTISPWRWPVAGLSLMMQARHDLGDAPSILPIPAAGTVFDFCFFGFGVNDQALSDQVPQVRTVAGRV